MKTHAVSRTPAAGFTLIELLVAMLIIGILVGIGAPSYLAQIRKSRRTEARMALLDLAGREERLFSTTGAYSITPADLGYGPAGSAFPMNVGSGYYQVSIVVGTGSTAAFTLTASPVPGQGQDKDAQCASFMVTQTGKQSAADSAENDAAVACWG